MRFYGKMTIGARGERVKVNSTAYSHNNQMNGYSMRHNTFQERLILCMRKTGLTQAKLHRELNNLIDMYGYDRVYDNVSFSKGLIWEYYHGICVPKSSRFKFLAKFFNVSEAWLEGSGNIDSELIGRAGFTAHVPVYTDHRRFASSRATVYDPAA